MSSFIGDPTRRTSVVERIAQGSATWIGAAAILAALVIVAGCSSPPKPTTVSASLQAGAGVNPDLRRRASPIVVRVYELKSAAAFDGADFVSLYERDQATLAAEMVESCDGTVRSNATRFFTVILRRLNSSPSPSRDPAA